MGVSSLVTVTNTSNFPIYVCGRMLMPGQSGSFPWDQVPPEWRDPTPPAGDDTPADNRQNAFTRISVSGQDNVNADSATDTLLLVAGSGITITTNAASDSITISATGGGSDPSTITEVSVSPSSLSLADGGSTGTLTATVTGTGDYDDSVTWESSDEAVATVAAGVVTPVGAGSATITATSVQDGTKSDTATVSVSSITAVSLSPETLELTAGGATGTLTPTVTGTGSFSTSVSWATSNAGVATVAAGVVTPVGAGSATITATSVQDGTKSDTAAVTVAAAEDTRPHIGVAGAYPGSSLATIFAALTAVSGSSNGSRVAGSSGSPLSVNPSTGEYGWFACLASGAPSGVVFNTSLGAEEWAGAASAGQFAGNEPIQTPTTTHQEYTDGNSNVWHLFRQNLAAVPAQIWTT